MQNDKVTIESDLIDLLTEQDEYNEKLEKSNNTIHILEEALKNARINGDARIRALVEACIKSSEKLVIRAAAEHDVAVATGTSAYFMLFGEELTGLLNELSMVHSNYVTDNYNNVEALARKCILMGHLMAAVYIQGVTICKTSANIESGESEYPVSTKIWQWRSSALILFDSFTRNYGRNQKLEHKCLEAVFVVTIDQRICGCPN